MSGKLIFYHHAQVFSSAKTGQPKTALFNVAITRYGVQTPILFS